MQAKKEVAATKSLQQSQPFPVFGSQLPAQLYAFLRLARLQEAGELTKVELERDTPVSQLNEYEALQRLLADLRERLYSFPKPGIDEELRIAKRQGSSASRERDVLAAELRYREKEVLRRAMQTVRDKLAPVRGVPTKDGKIENPNADLNEIFETLEAPFRAAKGFFDRLRPSA
jgi:histone-lysine N-methyltransferase SETD3